MSLSNSTQEQATRQNIGGGIEGEQAKPTLHDLFDIACSMAQDLQDYVNEGEKAGSEMLSTKEIINDFNKIYKAVTADLCPSCSDDAIYFVQRDDVGFWACENCDHQWDHG